MKVWITKYALTQGILVVEDAEICTTVVSGRMIEYRPDPESWVTYCHKPHWYTSEAEARERVRDMIVSKIKSLKKSLAQMQKLEKQFAN